MKFSDIEQFTAVGSYQVNVPLGFLVNSIDDYIKDYGLQLNPDFQRGYVWTQEQQAAYVEYLIKGGKANRIIYFNMPSWQGREAEPGEYDDFVCVDGLQRLTAVLKFMKNELKAFGHFLNEFEDRMPWLDILININNLRTKREVLTWYLEMNTGGTVHTAEDITKVEKLLEQEA